MTHPDRVALVRADPYMRVEEAREIMPHALLPARLIAPPRKLGYSWRSAALPRRFGAILGGLGVATVAVKQPRYQCAISVCAFFL